MRKYDLGNLAIEHLKLPTAREQKLQYTSQFLTGLQLVIAWRAGLPKISVDVAQKDPHTYFRYIWRYRYRKADGARTSIDLGFWPRVTQEQAVSQAKDVLLSVAEGRDPVKDRSTIREVTIPLQSVRTEKTVANLLDRFSLWRRESYKDKKATNDFYDKIIHLHIMPKWGLFGIDAVTPWAWQEYVRGVKHKKSHSLAKQVHSTWRAVFTYAVQSDDYPHLTANPFLQLPVVKEINVNVRDRYLSPQELHSWMNKIYTRGTETQARILMFQLYQGIRIQEVLNITLEDLKLLTESKIPIIVKGARPAITMVSRQAIDVVKDQLRYLVSNDLKHKYLFPSHADSKLPYTSRDMGSEVAKIRRHWIHFSTHDLRRTMRTWLQRFGCSKEMRDVMLNHSTPTGKDASYDHATLLDSQLYWAQYWADKLDEIKQNSEAFRMESDTSIDSASASELNDLLGQLI